MTAPARVLLAGDEVRRGVQRLASEISDGHPDGVVLVGILKGSVPFMADLMRALTVPCEIDFLAVSPYDPSGGRAHISKDIGCDIAGRDVVVVEDIVDTGLTLAYVLDQLDRRGPHSLEACVLLDKGARRIVPTPLAFVGFAIADECVVGYGADFAGRYRNLHDVVAGDLTALRASPDAHMEQLYAR